MANRTPPPAPSTLRAYMLVDSVQDFNVAEALVSNRSKNRATDLFRKQGSQPQFFADTLQAAFEGTLQKGGFATLIRNRQIATPPETYVVRYYVMDKQTPEIPPQIMQGFSKGDYDVETVVTRHKETVEKNVPYIRANNPLVQVNANMQRSITEAFAMMNSQLPWRFTFTRVTDPEDADIAFGAVPKSETMAGATQVETGAILLNTSEYKGLYNSDMGQTTLHEIGHALGLEHPQNFTKDVGMISTDEATFFDTVMTYDSNNQRSPHGASRTVNGLPTSLMPADIRALLVLYPTAQDRLVGKDLTVGSPTGTKPSAAVQLDVQSIPAKGQPYRSTILFPQNNMGINFQPIRDTENDTLHVRPHGSLSKPEPFEKPNSNIVYNDGTQTKADYRIDIRQVSGGIAVAQPYGEGTSFLPMNIEKIILSPDAERVATYGGVTIISPRNAPNRFASEYKDKDIFSIKGINNALSMSAAEIEETVLTIFPGAELNLTLRDMGEMKAHHFTNFLSPAYRYSKTPPDSLRATYRKDEKGEYHLEVHYSNEPTIHVRITLEDASPIDRARFEATLNTRLYTAGAPEDKIRIPVVNETGSAQSTTESVQSLSARRPQEKPQNER